MLYGLKEILDIGEENGFAVPAFNVYNLETVMGVMQAAVETGVDIPGQISLIGFDDVSFASLPKIQLTTISKPKEQICEVAVQTLEELIAADGPAPISCKTIEPVLVQRDTCGPSKGRALW